jgi:hypothetical protein
VTRVRKFIFIVSLLAALPFAKSWVVRGWEILRPPVLPLAAEDEG